MNAADQRRLTPWLVILCLVLAALWGVLASGVGRGVLWETPGTPHPLPATRHGVANPAPPLKHYAVIWQHPLFTMTRQPALKVAARGGQPINLDHFELTGVILAPSLHMALLRDRSDGHGVRVREGAPLAHTGWTLKTLLPHSAVFVGHGRRIHLSLKTAHHLLAATATAVPSHAMSTAIPQPVASPDDAASPAEHARIRAIKHLIEQRRRQQAAHAGDH